MRLVTVLGLVLALTAGPALAEPPANPPKTSGEEGAAGVDPERLEAAREVIRSAQGDRKAVLDSMRTPMVGMMQQMGLKEVEKARVMVDEVIMPILDAHYEELLSIQALTFAAVLPKEDLKAIAAFYATPAGRNLVKAQPQLTQASLTGLQKWLGTLQAEMQDKVAAAAEAHGWGTSLGRPGNRPKPN